jgi:cytochrome c oxidase subunit 4
MPRGAWSLVGIWALLLALLTATTAVSFAPLGPVKPALNLGIALIKAGLVVWFYMHVREQRWLTRLFAVAAIGWVLLLVTLTQTDLWTRGRLPL